MDKTNAPDSLRFSSPFGPRRVLKITGKTLVLTLGFLGGAELAFGYIDPGTTQSVFSLLGTALSGIIAFFLLLGASFKVLTKKMLKRLFHNKITGISVAIVTCGIFGTWFANSDSIFSRNSQETDQKRVVIIGFDGMDPALTKWYMDSGKLENFKALGKGGDFHPLSTVNPVQSPVVWTSIATGVGPGVHGISDFIGRKDSGYLPSLALTKRTAGGLSGLKSDPFQSPVDPKLFIWEKIRAAGRQAAVYRWPMTFPANGEATIITGLGTPDIYGGMGRYTLITSDPTFFREDIKGNVVAVTLDEFDDRGTSFVISGPESQLLGVKTKSETALTAKIKNPTVVTIKVEEVSKAVDIKKGKLSPWVSLNFSVGLGRSVSGMVQFLLLETSPGLHIYMSPIQIDPKNPTFQISNPESLAPEMANRLGSFHTLGLAEDTNALSDEILDEDQFLQLTESIMKESERVFWNRFNDAQSGLFAFVFDTTDRIQHMFWRYIDKNHPLYDSSMADRYSDVIESYYRTNDRIIGQVMAQLKDEDVLLVVSDHGFDSYRRSFHANSWLIENGYMTLKDPSQSNPGLFSNVDWSRTLAFAMGFSQIFLNVKGREETGIVSAPDVAALKVEISEKLLNAVDDRYETRVIDTVTDGAVVYTENSHLKPDLVIGMAKGYRFSWQTAVGGSPDYVFEDNLNKWSGDHCVDPSHVPGVIFANRKIYKDNPSVLDIAPSVLAHFGLKKTEKMPGSNLFEATIANR